MIDAVFRPDLAGQAPNATPLLAPGADAEMFAGLVDAYATAGTALERAQTAEHAFAAGGGKLQEMVFERARADAILNVASAAASKATQSLNAILNLQV